MTVLVVAADARARARLCSGLAGCSVFDAPSEMEALKTLRLVAVDLVVVDGTGTARDLPAFLTEVRRVAADALILAVGAPATVPAGADFSLPASATPRDLDGVVKQANERLRLLREVAILRAHAATPAAAAVPEKRERPPLARALREISRVLAVGLDVPRVLEAFLDAVGALVRPTRLALLLPAPTGTGFGGASAEAAYHVAAHRGLPPLIVQSARLPAADGLAGWLAREGRPARAADLAEPGAARELALLHAVVAVPLLARGELVAILAVGQPVVGGLYGREETEILFDLSTHLATAIREIELHQQLRREKDTHERILAHMSSGVVTIGRDQRVRTLNRRAEEILGQSAAELVGQDLRLLPSPLGDLLYEALTGTGPLGRREVQIALRARWLETSAYPVLGDAPEPQGAVLVFEDITDRKELATQKRRTEEAQLLARVVARIADEIKNPLVSINTFVELLEERFEEPDFRKHFSSVVRRDVGRMVRMFEKLTALVTETEVSPRTVDVRTLVDETVAAFALPEEGFEVPLDIRVVPEPEPYPARVDPAQARNALSYLVWYLIHNSPADRVRVDISMTRVDRKEGGGEDGIRVLIASRTATVATDKLDKLFDPVQMVQDSLFDVGPAVSQRLIEAQGGTLRVRQSRHELAFLVTLPVAS
jgi:PAS domain S-box-containing protein